MAAESLAARRIRSGDKVEVVCRGGELVVSLNGSPMDQKDERTKQYVGAIEGAAHQALCSNRDSLQAMTSTIKKLVGLESPSDPPSMTGTAR